MLALLCRDGMGGFGGLSAAEYDATSDRELTESYLAPRDEDHALIPLWRRQGRDESGDGPSPWAAFPSVEELGVPPEALTVTQPDGRRPPTSYLLMFWSVWRGRGMSTEGIMDRWRRKIAGA